MEGIRQRTDVADKVAAWLSPGFFLAKERSWWRWGGYYVLLTFWYLSRELVNARNCVSIYA